MTAFLITVIVLWILGAGLNLGKLDYPRDVKEYAWQRAGRAAIQSGLAAWALLLLVG